MHNAGKDEARRGSSVFCSIACGVGPEYYCATGLNVLDTLKTGMTESGLPVI